MISSNQLILSIKTATLRFFLTETQLKLEKFVVTLNSIILWKI